MRKHAISFVIPTLNEEENIQATIKSIRMFAPSWNYEVIVVDNGSQDNTIKLAEGEGALVVKNAGGTIASSRNKGVAHSNGEILVFLDADVLLTAAWQGEIENTILSIINVPMQVTGSRCSVPDEDNWILKYWYKKMRFRKENYINSGHLITSKVLFDKIGGFTEELKTAEDYDFSMKARQAGAQIINNPNLVAVHTGYPRTIRAFVKRERWHGREDFSSIGKMLASKEAILVILNMLLLTVFILLPIVYFNISYLFFYIPILSLIAGLVAYVKFGFGSFRSFLGSSMICVMFICGRTLSLLDSFRTRQIFSN